MRILVIVHEYPPVGGGGGRAAQDIGKLLASQGHEIRLFTAHFGELPKTEEQDGMLIYRLKSGRTEPFRAGLIAMGLFILAGTTSALRLARHWKPDVLHIHFAMPSGVIGWFFHRVMGIPYVLTAHLGDVPGGVPEKTDRWFRWVYPFSHAVWKNAARVVAVSEYTRQLALQHYPVEIQVIPNGVDLSDLNPGEICAGEIPAIVFAGRFMPQKNLPQLVRSLAEVQDLPWNCILLGDGPERQALEEQIQQAGLTGRFTLPGWVTPSEVIAVLSQSDILFIPSLSEGLPLVGVQSLALGLAVVGSKAGGLVDIVDHGVNGFLVEKTNPGGYAQALREILSDQELLLAFRHASRAKAGQFDLDFIGRAYSQLFASCVAESQSTQDHSPKEF
jgi:L-malate glycosyltransferase